MGGLPALINNHQQSENCEIVLMDLIYVTYMEQRPLHRHNHNSAINAMSVFIPVDLIIRLCSDLRLSFRLGLTSTNEYFVLKESGHCQRSHD